jgi:hypothetical protein
VRTNVEWELAQRGEEFKKSARASEVDGRISACGRSGGTSRFQIARLATGVLIQEGSGLCRCAGAYQCECPGFFEILSALRQAVRRMTGFVVKEGEYWTVGYRWSCGTPFLDSTEARRSVADTSQDSASRLMWHLKCLQTFRDNFW